MKRSPHGLGPEAPTLDQLLEKLATLPPDQAATILASVQPMPTRPPANDGEPPPPPVYLSWHNFLARTAPAERRKWCAAKVQTANRDRLISGVPTTKITVVDVLSVLTAAEGRCGFCRSLAVERRPSRPNGGPLPWASVGRRIGSLGHAVARFHGGANEPANLVWSCLWCNDWPGERTPGATDHGAIR